VSARRFRTRWIGWLLTTTLALLAAGCAGQERLVTEPLRVGNVANLTPESLGLQPGITTFDEARARLAGYQATGIAGDAYAREPGSRIAVLGADYQRQLHVFRNGRYDHSLFLETHGVPAYGLALRLSNLGSSLVLLVLYRDPLERADHPPTILAYYLDNGHFRPWTIASLESPSSQHPGMTSPMFVGNDLGDGIVLVARDRQGSLWTAGYLLRVEQGQLTAHPRSMADIMRCSCVREYASGRRY
jgi:hypothetical protein